MAEDYKEASRRSEDDKELGGAKTEGGKQNERGRERRGKMTAQITGTESTGTSFWDEGHEDQI